MNYPTSFIFFVLIINSLYYGSCDADDDDGIVKNIIKDASRAANIVSAFKPKNRFDIGNTTLKKFNLNHMPNKKIVRAAILDNTTPSATSEIHSNDTIATIASSTTTTTTTTTTEEIPLNDGTDATTTSSITEKSNISTVTTAKASNNALADATTTPPTTTTTTAPITITSTLPTTTSNSTFNPDADYQEITPVEDVPYISILTGLPIKKGHFGWHVDLRFSNNRKDILSTCSGALVTQYDIVSVARCFFYWELNATETTVGVLFKYVQVSAGGVDRRYLPFSVWIEIQNGSNTIIHEDFNRQRKNKYLANNIAILKSPVSVSGRYVTPIKLNEIRSDFANYDKYMSGWARDRVLLRYQIFNLVPNRECRLAYGPRVCTSGVLNTYGAKTYDDSICRVESGSPLIISSDDTSPRLIGLASFISKNGCGKDSPDGYVKIAYYYNWLTDNGIILDY